MRNLFASIGLSTLLLGSASAQQPASQPQPVWVYEFSLQTDPVSLSHSEKVRSANKPVPTTARPADTGEDITGGGLVGRVSEVGEVIKGYKIVSTFKIGDETFRVWEPDNGPTTESSAPAGRFDDIFDGQATSTVQVTATAQYRDPNIVLATRLNPQPPTYTFTGAAQQSTQFQKDFKARVQARLGAIVDELRNPVALTDAEQKQLSDPHGGKVVQTRKITFFEKTTEMRITITSSRKINIPLGSE